MANLNRVTLIGRLGKDPESKVTNSGAEIVTISLATTKEWKKKDGLKEQRTEWHRVKVFGVLANICMKYLEKGREVYVEGELTTRSWEAEDGSKRYATEIIANNIQFLTKNEKRNDDDYPSFSDDSEMPF